MAWEIHRGACEVALADFEKDRFQCVVTSPPYYWQRDYKVEGQIGLEPTIPAYVNSVKLCMNAVKRVLRPDGLLFLNLGDTYYSAKGMPKGDDKKNRGRRLGLRAVDASGLGVPRKTALGMPWRVALAMIADDWILRSPIIWERTHPMPEASAHDRPWRSYETVFMFAKSPRYQFDRSKLQGEDIWRMAARPENSKGLHSAAFPEELAAKCINVATKPGDEVLDPFAGTGSTLAAALKINRPAVGIDISHDYCKFASERVSKL